MKSNKLISLSVPNLIGNEKKYLEKCINTSMVSSFGKYVNIFEDKLKNFTKSKNAICCNSGTSAIHLGLRVLGINPGDEVIVPTMSFIATANSVRYLQANPIFMDCDDFYNLDVKKTLTFIEKETYFKNGFTYNVKTKKKIKALIIVHVFGNAADLQSILKVCKKRNIKILEDAAGALGTRYIKGGLKGKHVGTIGDIGCISFNGNKIITTGGGGVLLTNDLKLAKKAKYLSTTAINDKLNYKHDDIGYNFRLSNIHAAIGIAQLEKINFFLKKKKTFYEFYTSNLGSSNFLSFDKKPNYANNNNWMVSIRLKKHLFKLKSKFLIFLNKNNIEARSIWTPLHLQKKYKKYQNYKLYNSIKLFNSSINIPSSTNLKISDLKKVLRIIEIFFKNV